jgi:hypothetical protein
MITATGFDRIAEARSATIFSGTSLPAGARREPIGTDRQIVEDVFSGSLTYGC